MILLPSPGELAARVPPGLLTTAVDVCRSGRKPRIQRPEEFTSEATKGKGTVNTSWQAPSYLLVRQDYPRTLTLREYIGGKPV
jgi:hypothetical protein